LRRWIKGKGKGFKVLGFCDPSKEMGSGVLG